MPEDKIKVRFTTSRRHDGYEKDKEYDLAPAEAQRWLRRGFAKVVDTVKAAPEPRK
jgi:hypothetical protein